MKVKSIEFIPQYMWTYLCHKERFKLVSFHMDTQANVMLNAHMHYSATNHVKSYYERNFPNLPVITLVHSVAKFFFITKLFCDL
jgi:hypothetical protein